MANKNRLIKFKDAHSKEPTYVNIDDIFSITKITGNTGGTLIVSSNGYNVNVEEHITEVIAAVEERDSLPAKVLFGNKGD